LAKMLLNALITGMPDLLRDQVPFDVEKAFG
jgi:hypothetical protein